MIKITKPLVSFDLETTGTDISKDKVIQLATSKIFLDGTVERKKVYINPIMVIPEESTKIHGITNEMLEGCKPFSSYAKSLHDYMYDCDFSGFNIEDFDIPMLAEEFARCKLTFPNPDSKIIDVYKLERIVNSHKLGHTYKRYTGKDLENAHDAMSDVDASDVVLECITLKNNIEFSVEAIDKILSENKKFKKYDLSGKMIYNNEGVVVWNFSQNKGLPVLNDKNFANWVLNKEFTQETKVKIIRLFEENNIKL